MGEPEKMGSKMGAFIFAIAVIIFAVFAGLLVINRYKAQTTPIEAKRYFYYISYIIASDGNSAKYTSYAGWNFPEPIDTYEKIIDAANQIAKYNKEDRVVILGIIPLGESK